MYQFDMFNPDVTYLSYPTDDGVYARFVYNVTTPPLEPGVRYKY